MDETALATLDQLSKLPQKKVLRKLSAEGGVAAMQIYNLLKSSAAMGEWDLFEEAMFAIPDNCMKHVIRDAGDGFDLFLAASGSDDVPSDVLLSMIRRFPSLREHKGEDGDTLLHVLCKIENPPEHVIKCIDELCSFRLQRTAMQNNKGYTPLHYAMKFSNVEVVRKITQVFPDMVTMKTTGEHTPLHFFLIREETSIDAFKIIEAQVNACPNVMKCQSELGRTPLHVYFFRRGIGRSDEIKALLKADPSAATCLDGFGETPFYDLCEHYCENENKSDSESDNESERQYSLTNEPPEEYKRDSFVDFWRSVSMLLLAATKACLWRPAMTNKNVVRWKEMDAIVELGRLVPWQLFVMAAWEHFGHPDKPDADGMVPLHYIARGPIEWENGTSDSVFPIPSILEEFPDSVKMQDLRGRLPLHIAAACKYHKDDEGSIEGNNVTNITRLVAAYPQGAETKTRFGSFPLHLAIKARKHWRPDMWCILEAAPPVVSKPDPCSRLYPFMLAAVGEKASESVVYELLRRDPSLVEMGIREGEDEKYLKQRISDMESKLRELENEIKSIKSKREHCDGSFASDAGKKKRAKKT